MKSSQVDLDRRGKRDENPCENSDGNEVSHDGRPRDTQLIAIDQRWTPLDYFCYTRLLIYPVQRINSASYTRLDESGVG